MCKLTIMLAVLCTVLALAPMIYAQSMGGAYTYSSAAPDEYGLHGCGMTEDSYNSYNHRYRVDSTLKSPNGRSSSGSTSYVSPPAQAYTYLSWDNSDEGDYAINSQHLGFCPIANAYFPMGGTGIVITLQFPRNMYELRYWNVTTMNCTYYLTCNVPPSCPPPSPYFYVPAVDLAHCPGYSMGGWITSINARYRYRDGPWKCIYRGIFLPGSLGCS